VAETWTCGVGLLFVGTVGNVMPESTVWYLMILSNGCAGGYLAGSVAPNLPVLKVLCWSLTRSLKRQLVERSAAI
jgi:hypothetical protein